MSTELGERNRSILEAIIEEHIATAEPVGSRTVAKRHKLGLSPATIRNVMADLEEFGFLQSPHTSAGRVPTEKGYRFYVDSLLQVRKLNSAERKQLESRYQLRGRKVEEVLRDVSKTLSSISHYTGLVMAPRLETTVFRHIEFVPLSEGRVLVVFVTRSGLVQNKIIETRVPVSRRELEQISNYLNRTLAGLSIQQVKEKIFAEMQEEKARYDRLMSRTLELSREALKENLGGEVFIEGTSNILDQPEFANVETMRGLFRAFEQKSTLIDLLNRSQQADGVQIFIGSEPGITGIQGCSLITCHYASKRGTIGALGVIGPSRMNYSSVIPVVDYTARLLSQVLDGDLD
ncbi:heat-inducible transcription repressor HrcA [Geothermobacter hydrogeniphilus]|uniref:Heat-inducible transcription repressor HrcA n=1 Tax=Geothermobacter hydrogeniphilus TaxID=1969733 RepID=A0A2K2H684_9BACT|nr:heat-inducible transcriptional repressor HrcA [Geothermobacter hydrogeniphilus]PNU18723.1 heat-inducible transcription repressor HrcA [Geothermobacter hydrogeniphilus]